jgi:hypothetical protein
MRTQLFNSEVGTCISSIAALPYCRISTLNIAALSHCRIAAF